jgi:hypothetical protein
MLTFPSLPSSDGIVPLQANLIAPVQAGERFTMNLIDPIFKNSAEESEDAVVYSTLMSIATFSMMAAFFMVNGVMVESIRLVKLSVFMSANVFLSLAWVFTIEKGKDCDGDQVCQQIVAGIVFVFFQSIILLAAGSSLLQAEEDGFQNASGALPKVADQAVAADPVAQAPGASFPTGSHVVTSSV